jgi:predicted RNA binding protein YcfA (HicA-like mRNA interferase family)
MLLQAGFRLVRSKGSHRIYMRGTTRTVVPFHAGQTLHPKIVKQVVEAAGEIGN